MLTEAEVFEALEWAERLKEPQTLEAFAQWCTRPELLKAVLLHHLFDDEPLLALLPVLFEDDDESPDEGDSAAT